MPLNLSTNDGDFVPYLKYNAKAGRFYVRPQGAQQDVEVINPRLVFDMANIKTGWLFYQEGIGPEKVWDPDLVNAAPRPAGPRKFKRGFEVMVYGNDDLPGIGRLELREFSSTASNVIGVINQMYTAYEQGMKANDGKMPFYRCDGVQAIQGAYGTNYEPQFRLIGWVDRIKVPAFDEFVRKTHAPTPPPAPPVTARNGHDTAGTDPFHLPDGRPNAPMDDSIPF